jgi:CPA1 family monovalent cation:H+ antiporter
MFAPSMRLAAETIWSMVAFFLNSLAFFLIGLQLPALIERLHVAEQPQLILLALLVSMASVAIRFIWVFFMSYGLRGFMPSPLRLRYYPAWQNIFVVAWTGMRGVVTLALALALPLTLTDGTAFPQRDLIVFLSVSVILFTLLVQGISLPWLSRMLGISFDPKRTREEWLARTSCARQALARLDELELADNVHMPALMRIRQHFEERIESLGDEPGASATSDQQFDMMSHPLIKAEKRLWAEVLRRERETLIRMRHDYTIGDDVMNDILRELDLLSTRYHYSDELLPETLPAPGSVEAENPRSIWYQPRLRKLLKL